MKKGKNITLVLLAFILLFSFNHKVMAMTEEEFGNLESTQMYIIGDYMFDISTYNPTIRDLMIAARTLDTDDVEIIEVFKFGNILQASTVFSQELIDTNTFLTDYVQNVNQLIKKENGQKVTETYSYSVKFYDGDVFLSTEAVNNGDTATRPTNPTKEGYAFVDWRLNNQTYLFNTPVTNNISLFANWLVNTYTVKFNDNVDDMIISVPLDLIKTYGANAEIIGAAPVRTGYTFLGWSKNNAATTATYGNLINSDLTNNRDDQTLYAIWDIIKYNVTFKANGEEVENLPATQTKEYGSTLVLSSTEPTMPGHTFTGWNTLSNGDGDDYAAGGNYTDNTGVSLYAQWTINTYSITYNAEGAYDESIPATQTKEYNKPIQLSNFVPVKNGFVFNSWNTQADGDGTRFAKGAIYTVNGSLNLYAMWDEAVSVTFHKGNEFYPTPVVKNKVINTGNITNYNYLTSIPGLSFAGWFRMISPLDDRCSNEDHTFKNFGSYGTGDDAYLCNGNGDVVEEFDIDTEVVNSNLELYGYFIEVPFTITYNLDNGTSETIDSDEIDREHGIELPDVSLYTVPEDALGNAATFAGWSTVKGGCVNDSSNVCILKDGDADLILEGYNIYEDTTLYALWDYNSVNVDYYFAYDYDFDTWSEDKMFGDSLTKETEYVFRDGDDINYSTGLTLNEYATDNNLILVGWSYTPMYEEGDYFESGMAFTATSDDTIYSKTIKLYPILIYDEMVVKFDTANMLDLTIKNNEIIQDKVVNYNDELIMPTQLFNDPPVSSGFVWLGWYSQTDFFNNAFYVFNEIKTVNNVLVNDSSITNFNFGIVYMDFLDDYSIENEVTFMPRFAPSWYVDLVDESKPEVTNVSITSSSELYELPEILDDLKNINKNITITINTPMYLESHNESSILSGMSIPSNVTIVMGQYEDNNLRFQVSGTVYVDGTLIVHQETLQNGNRGSFDIYTGPYEGSGKIVVNYGGKFKVKTASTTEEFVGNTNDSTLKMLNEPQPENAFYKNTTIALKNDDMAHSVTIETGRVEINKANFGILSDAFVIQNNEVYILNEGTSIIANITMVVDGAIEGSGELDLADDIHLYLGNYNGVFRMPGYIDSSVNIRPEDVERVHLPDVEIMYENNLLEVTNMPEDDTIAYGESYQVPDKEPIRSGYHFVGWMTMESNDVYCMPGDTLPNLTQSISLIPKWEEDVVTYSITYHKNGVEWTTFPENETEITAGSGRNTSTVQPGIVGYNFLGWSTTVDGDVEYGVNADLGEINSNIDLYAISEQLVQ